MLRTLVLFVSLFVLVGCTKNTPTPTPTPAAVRKGPRVVHGRTVRVHFEGNAAIPTEDLLAAMKIDKSPEEDEGEAHEILARDVLLLHALYYDRGYMQVQIGEARVAEAEEGPFVDVTIPIEKEGKRIKLRRLTIFERDENGREVETLGGGREALRRRLSAVDGAWFARNVLVRDLDGVRRLYRDAGYANVEVEPETELDERNAAVDVIIPIRRGPFMRVEKIEIVGNEKVPTERIAREIEPRVGEPFNDTKLEASKARIVALKLFRSLDVSTKVGADPEHLIITFEVVEK